MALIGRVVAMTGVAYLITDNGAKRELQLGDQIQIGDTIQTLRGVEVDLELASGRVIHISAEQLVAFTEELAEVIVPSNLDSAINLATIDTVIKAIEEGKDVNEVLEETAAGSGGQSNSYGFGFVDLLRINDILNAFKFAYEYEAGGRIEADTSVVNDSNALIIDQGNQGAGTVASINTPPVATPLAIGRDEGTGSYIGALTATDANGDTLTYSPTGVLPAGLVLNPDGSFTFDYSNPAYDYLAVGVPQVLVVPYVVLDGKGGASSSTLTVTVNGTNDAPVAVAAVEAVLEDVSLISGQLAATDLDTTDTLTYSANAGQAAIAGLTVNADGSYSFDASNAAYQRLVAGEPLVLIYNYDVTDGTTTASSTLTITVTGTNDAPVASAYAATGLEDAAGIAVNLTGTDVDGTIASVNISTLPLASEGVLYLADGITVVTTAMVLTPVQAAGLIFTPELNFNGTVNIPFTVTDNLGLASTSASNAVITVTAVNDAASISGTAIGALNEDSAAIVSGTLTVADVDTGEAGFQAPASLSGTYGSFTFNAATGAWTYALDNSLPAVQAMPNGTIVTDSLTVTSIDGTASQPITITITGSNDAPTLAAISLNTIFTEAAGSNTQAAAVTVFGSATISTVESGQTLKGLTFTVSGLADGASERIVVDGRAIALGTNSSGTTVANGMSYSVTIAGDTATVVLSKAVGISPLAMQTLVNGITYQDVNHS